MMWEDGFFIEGRTIDIINGNPGFVYFIQCQDSGPIKIGYTKNINKRLYELQVGCPFELNLLVSVRGNELWEKDLHEYYKNFHVRGEWFLPCNKLMKEISAIKDALCQS